ERRGKDKKVESMQQQQLTLSETAEDIMPDTHHTRPTAVTVHSTWPRALSAAQPSHERPPADGSAANSNAISCGAPPAAASATSSNSASGRSAAIRCCDI